MSFTFEAMENLPALSVRPPWSWLIVNRFKPIENRNWYTVVRGAIYIHAGKKFDHEGYVWVQRQFPHIVMPAPHEFQLGGIVGRARLVNCVEDHDSPWFFGRYGFVLTDAEPLPFRACRGQLGFFRPV